jgi:hypothetical protein
MAENVVHEPEPVDRNFRNVVTVKVDYSGSAFSGNSLHPFFDGGIGFGRQYVKNSRHCIHRGITMSERRIIRAI